VTAAYETALTFIENYYRKMTYFLLFADMAKNFATEQFSIEMDVRERLGWGAKATMNIGEIACVVVTNHSGS